MQPNLQKEFFEDPTQDYLNLYEGSEVNAKKVVQILDYSKDQVAVAAGVNKASVRFDAKIPHELKERILEWATALNLVASYFKDENRTIRWFKTVNPMLGNMSPRDMIRLGRYNKLMKFIQTALSENGPKE